MNSNKSTVFTKWLIPIMMLTIGLLLGIFIGGHLYHRLTVTTADAGDIEIQRWASDVQLLLNENGGIHPPEEIRSRLVQRVSLQTVNVGHLHYRVRASTSLRAALRTATAIERSAELSKQIAPGFGRHASAVRACIIAGGGEDARQVAECSSRVISGE